jgi:hypothetical protein
MRPRTELDCTEERTHADWREPVDFMHHCSTKWATVLVGLRSGLEGGAFTAFPDDTKVSSSWR